MTGTDRLKLNPPLGRMPVLQFLLPGELQVDPAYQRSIDNGSSQALIRSIAQHWNWDLCQPLVIARRQVASGSDGAGQHELLFVIDGQHRLAAAKLRGDIAQLPCVVVDLARPEDEAASFVHLNARRRPLAPIDLFKAAVASGDAESVSIASAMAESGLVLAPHLTSAAWKPGMTGNIPGIQAAWRREGPAVTSRALVALAQGFEGEVLHYAGTIFPGIVAVCADEMQDNRRFTGDRFEKFVIALAVRGQVGLRQAILRASADDPDLSRQRAALTVLRQVWKQAQPIGHAIPRTAAPPPPPASPRRPRTAPAGPFARTPADAVDEAPRAWCEQCEKRVDRAQSAACQSPFCKLRTAAAVKAEAA
jgi:hypothetical protein